MGKFVERMIEEYWDGLNTTYFLHGEEPLPRVLVDDISQCTLHKFGTNAMGEKMYYRVEH